MPLCPLDLNDTLLNLIARSDVEGLFTTLKTWDAQATVRTVKGQLTPDARRLKATVARLSIVAYEGVWSSLQGHVPVSDTHLGRTALMRILEECEWVADPREPEVVRALLAATLPRGEANTVTADGGSALEQALLSNNPAAFEVLWPLSDTTLLHAMPSKKGPHKNLTFVAVAHANVAMAKTVLDHDPDGALQIDEKGNSLLHTVLERSDHLWAKHYPHRWDEKIEMLEWLLSQMKPAMVWEQNHRHQTGLSLAIGTNDTRATRCLIAHGRFGSPSNVQDEIFTVASSLALRSKKWAVLQDLIHPLGEEAGLRWCDHQDEWLRSEKQSFVASVLKIWEVDRLHEVACEAIITATPLSPRARL